MSIGTVATAIDKITPKTPTALRVVFGKTAGNETDLNFYALDGKDYVTRQMVEDFVGPSSSLRLPKIAAGTAMPKNYTSADIPTLSVSTSFLIEIATSSTTNEPINSPRIVRNFTDSTKANVASIDVYGNNDGSGNFNEDTWLIVQ